MPRSDADIKESVVDQLEWDDLFDAKDVHVEVREGVVTLTGTVPSYRAMQSAVIDASHVDGAISVDNGLTIAYPESADLPEDAELAEQVKDRLRSDPELSSYSIDVAVAVGMAILRGTVNSYWEKIEAQNIAAGLMGITEVDNRLDVVPRDGMPDDEIAHKIRQAIERNALVNGDNVHVQVEDATVKLTGTVDTRAARDAAYRSALYTPSVVMVEEQINVRPRPGQ